MRGWRKWSAVMVGVAAVTTLALMDRLDATAGSAISSMVIAYCAANYGVHRAQKGD